MDVSILPSRVLESRRRSQSVLDATYKEYDFVYDSAAFNALTTKFFHRRWNDIKFKQPASEAPLHMPGGDAGANEGAEPRGDDSHDLQEKEDERGVRSESAGGRKSIVDLDDDGASSVVPAEQGRGNEASGGRVGTEDASGDGMGSGMRRAVNEAAQAEGETEMLKVGARREGEVEASIQRQTATPLRRPAPARTSLFARPEVHRRLWLSWSLGDSHTGAATSMEEDDGVLPHPLLGKEMKLSPGKSRSSLQTLLTSLQAMKEREPHTQSATPTPHEDSFRLFTNPIFDQINVLIQVEDEPEFDESADHVLVRNASSHRDSVMGRMGGSQPGANSLKDYLDGPAVSLSVSRTGKATHAELDEGFVTHNASMNSIRFRGAGCYCATHIQGTPLVLLAVADTPVLFPRTPRRTSFDPSVHVPQYDHAGPYDTQRQGHDRAHTPLPDNENMAPTGVDARQAGRDGCGYSSAFGGSRTALCLVDVSYPKIVLHLSNLPFENQGVVHMDITAVNSAPSDFTDEVDETAASTVVRATMNRNRQSICNKSIYSGAAAFVEPGTRDGAYFDEEGGRASLADFSPWDRSESIRPTSLASAMLSSTKGQAYALSLLLENGYVVLLMLEPGGGRAQVQVIGVFGTTQISKQLSPSTAVLDPMGKVPSRAPHSLSAKVRSATHLIANEVFSVLALTISSPFSKSLPASQSQALAGTNEDSMQDLKTFVLYAAVHLAFVPNKALPLREQFSIAMDRSLARSMLPWALLPPLAERVFTQEIPAIRPFHMLPEAEADADEIKIKSGSEGAANVASALATATKSQLERPPVTITVAKPDIVDLDDESDIEGEEKGKKGNAEAGGENESKVRSLEANESVEAKALVTEAVEPNAVMNAKTEIREMLDALLKLSVEDLLHVLDYKAAFNDRRGYQTAIRALILSMRETADLNLLKSVYDEGLLKNYRLQVIASLTSQAAEAMRSRREQRLSERWLSGAGLRRRQSFESLSARNELRSASGMEGRHNLKRDLSALYKAERPSNAGSRDDADIREAGTTPSPMQSPPYEEARLPHTKHRRKRSSLALWDCEASTSSAPQWNDQRASVDGHPRTLSGDQNFTVLFGDCSRGLKGFSSKLESFMAFGSGFGKSFYRAAWCHDLLSEMGLSLGVLLCRHWAVILEPIGLLIAHHLRRQSSSSIDEAKLRLLAGQVRLKGAQIFKRLLALMSIEMHGQSKDQEVPEDSPRMRETYIQTQDDTQRDTYRDTQKAEEDRQAESGVLRMQEGLEAVSLEANAFIEKFRLHEVYAISDTDSLSRQAKFGAAFFLVTVECLIDFTSSKLRIFRSTETT